ncbi:S53 family peptidase [Granulicella arctica]|uniref:S53 family peptidase n=1 Tax=Granulicella arctica TaxID=940613 RepID=UPI0021E08ABE|nr:S53 family peptidase [Granulicella arctica]
MAPKKIAARFAAQEKQVLPGSEKEAFHTAAEKAATGKIVVSVVVRRKSPLNTKTLGKVRLTRTEYAKNHAADKADLKLIKAFATEYGLTVEKDTPKPERRTVLISGSAAAMQKAFGVTLKQVTTDSGSFRIREGAIYVPSELAGVVVAVLGLDNRPQAQPHFRILKESAPGSGIRPNAAAANTSFTPVQIAALYGFPTTGATGQTIGIIELGGGYKTADLTAYFKTLGQKAPSVTAVSVDGGKSKSDGINGADGEVMLDIEVAAAVAPGAKIVVYFAPNTDQGFIDAIASAVHDTKNKPSVISISWGGRESSWTQQSLTALDAACQSAAALGITITVAAGDNGSGDGGSGNNVDFPASSPHVLACGGTKLVGSGSTISSEVVWNETAANEGATGGGVSTKFALPSWQASSAVPKIGTFVGRGVPDVSGDADPATGYTIRVDGQTIVIGGTSAVAPLWAGLIAVSNAANKKSAGFIQPTIYAAKGKSAFRDITSGNNGTYKAGPGWDACTGLGSPIGNKIVTLLGAAAATNKAAAKKAKAAK